MVAAHQVCVDPVNPVRWSGAVGRGVELGKQTGQGQQGGGENQRDHAGHVDLEWNIGVGAANGASTNHALCVLHRDTANGLLHIDHSEHNQQADAADSCENTPTVGALDGA